MLSVTVDYEAAFQLILTRIVAACFQKWISQCLGQDITWNESCSRIDACGINADSGWTYASDQLLSRILSQLLSVTYLHSRAMAARTWAQLRAPVLRTWGASRCLPTGTSRWWRSWGPGSHNRSYTGSCTPFRTWLHLHSGFQCCKLARRIWELRNRYIPPLREYQE